MKGLIGVVSLLALSVRVWAAPTLLATYEWDKLAANGKLLSGTVTTESGRPILTLSNTSAGPINLPLLRIEAPTIQAPVYALSGKIRYQGVQRESYLEMWNHFPSTTPGIPGNRYFSRTLGKSGPMQRIRGDSGWRDFVLPFDRAGGSVSPSRLEFNLVLPAAGSVTLGEIRLTEFSGGLQEAMQPPGAWFSDRTAGLIGGIGGAILGCLVPALGWLARKGKCRSFVMGTLVTLIILGALLTVLGITALALKQPYGVWFVFMLSGILLVSILPSQILILRRTFDELGMRRMSAMD
jgi:hypothetical protein